MLLAGSALLIYASWATVINRSFYADGSFFYLYVVAHPEAWTIFDDPKHIRYLINVVNQFPLDLLIRAGVEDPASLRIAFNAPLFFGNIILLLWLAAMCRKYKEYWIVALATASYAFFVLPSDIFSVNQARLAQTLYWIPLYLTLTRHPVSRGAKLAGLTTIVVCFRSHESIILFGPLLSLSAWISLRNNPHDRALKSLLMAMGLGLCGFGLYWQLAHPVSKETEGFLNNLKYISAKDLFRTNLAFTTLPTIGFLLTPFLTHRPDGWRISQNIAWTILIACVITAASVIYGPGRIHPSQEFSFRVLIPFGGAIFILLAIATQKYPSLRTAFPRNTTIILISASLLGHSIWQCVSNIYWDRFTTATRTVIEQSAHPIVTTAEMATHMTALEQNLLLKYKWGWTWPAFSLVISDDKHINAIIAPEDHFDDFHITTGNKRVLHIPFTPLTDGAFDLSRIFAACMTDKPQQPICLQSSR
jgi:hypothetical protein